MKVKVSFQLCLKFVFLYVPRIIQLALARWRYLGLIKYIGFTSLFLSLVFKLSAPIGTQRATIYGNVCMTIYGVF